MEGNHRPRIFLCHAKEDKPQVMELYHRLKEAGYDPWLDKYDLLGGQNWRSEIRRIIADPYNLVVVCLSCNSVTKRGVVQQEIAWALNVLEQTPEGAIYLIPARLEDCQVPDRLADLHWVDLFEPDGFEYLKHSLDYEIGKRKSAATPGSVSPTVAVDSGKRQALQDVPPIIHPLQPFEPELILIPAGEFLMGSDPKRDKDAYVTEQPQRTLYLPGYHIAKTPVTNAQYAAFVRATEHRAPEYWHGDDPPKDKEDHPVVWVSWYDAVAYCDWLTEMTGNAYRPPSEAQWEKAARGMEGRIYPWGDELPGEGRCNFGNNVGRTMPIGQYSPQGDSPYGCVDMAGNVWEWTASLYKHYPYDPRDGREGPNSRDYCVLRGGAFYCSKWLVRCACRNWYPPGNKYDTVGFRLCVAPGLYSSPWNSR